MCVCVCVCVCVCACACVRVCVCVCVWSLMVTVSCIGVHSRDMLFLSPEFWKCLGCQIDMLSSDVTSPTLCVSVKTDLEE